MEDLKNIEFYRYYKSNQQPFVVSYEPINKYGNGIYFLNNPYYYKDKFKNDGRLVVIIPKLKNPLILRNHKNETPSREYTDMLLKAISLKDVKNRQDFTNKLIDLGYDSLVVFEKRHVYLILFSNDPSLYEVISDTIPNDEVNNEMAIGGEISPLPFVSSSANAAIKEVIALPKYKDVSETEASIIYAKWKNDLETPIWFDMDEKKFNTPFLNKLVDKDYLEIYYDDSNMQYLGSQDYILSEKGKEFVSAVMNRYLTRLGVKKGIDLFPDNANIKEVDDKKDKLKNRWSKIGNRFSNEPFADLYGKEVMDLLNEPEKTIEP